MRGGGTRRVPTADRHLDDARWGSIDFMDDETIATAHRRLARRHHLTSARAPRAG